MALTATRSFSPPSGGTISIKVNSAFAERIDLELMQRYLPNTIPTKQEPNRVRVLSSTVTSPEFPDGEVARVAANKWSYVTPCPIEFEVDLSAATFDTTREFDALADGFVNDTPDYLGNPSSIVESGVYPKGFVTDVETGRYDPESWYDPTYNRLDVFWTYGDTGEWSAVADHIPAEYSQKNRDLGLRSFHTYTDAAMTAAGTDYTVKVLVYERSSGKIATATTTVNVKNHLFNADKIILVNNATVADGGVAANEDFSAFTATHNALLAANWQGEVIERNLVRFVDRPNTEPYTFRTKFGTSDNGDYSGTEFTNDPYTQYAGQDNVVWLFKGNDEADAPEYLFYVQRKRGNGKAQVFGSYGAGRAKIDNPWNGPLLDGIGTWDDETLELTLCQTRFMDFWVQGIFNPKTDMVSEGARGAMGGYQIDAQEGQWLVIYNCQMKNCCNKDGIYKQSSTSGTGLEDGTAGSRLSLVNHSCEESGGEYLYIGRGDLDVLGSFIHESEQSQTRLEFMDYQNGPNTNPLDMLADPPEPRTPDTGFSAGEYLYDLSQTSADGSTYVRAKILKAVDAGKFPFSAAPGKGVLHIARVLDENGDDALFSKGGVYDAGGDYESSVNGVFTNGFGVQCTIELQGDGARFQPTGKGAFRNSTFRSSEKFSSQFSKSRIFNLGPDFQMIYKMGNKAALGSWASHRFCVFESTSLLLGINPVGGDYTDFASIRVQCCIGIGTQTTGFVFRVSSDSLSIENFVMWFPGWNNETPAPEGAIPDALGTVRALEDLLAQPEGANPRRYGGAIDVNGVTGVCNFSQTQRGESTSYYNGFNNNYEEPGELIDKGLPVKAPYGGVPGGTHQKIKEYNVLTSATRQNNQNFPDMEPIDWVDGTYTTGSDPLLDLGPRTSSGGYIQPLWIGFRTWDDPLTDDDDGFVSALVNRPQDVTDRKMPSFKPMSGSAAIGAGDGSYRPLLLDYLGYVRGPKFSIGAAEVDENLFGLPRVE